MTLRVLSALLCTVLVACGGTDASTSAGTGGDGGSGGMAGTGGAAGSGGSGGGFVPPADSYSVKWGPTTVPAGTESTQCVVKRLGNSGSISVHEIHNSLGATSHHFIVYRVNDTVERPDPYPCQPFSDTFNDPPLNHHTARRRSTHPATRRCVHAGAQSDGALRASLHQRERRSPGARKPLRPSFPFLKKTSSTRPTSCSWATRTSTSRR